MGALTNGPASFLTEPLPSLPPAPPAAQQSQQGVDWGEVLRNTLMGASLGLASPGGQGHGEMFRTMMLNQQLQRQQAGAQSAAEATGAIDQLIGQGKHDEAAALLQNTLRTPGLSTEGFKALAPYGEKIAKTRADLALRKSVAAQMAPFDPLAAGLLMSGVAVPDALKAAEHVRNSGDFQVINTPDGGQQWVSKHDSTKVLREFQGPGIKLEAGATYAKPGEGGAFSAFTVPKTVQFTDHDAPVRDSLTALGTNPNEYNRLAVSQDPADQAKYSDLTQKASLRAELLKRNPAVTQDMLLEAQRMGIAIDPVQGYLGLNQTQAGALLNAVDQRQIRKTVQTEIQKYNAMLDLPVSKALPDLKNKTLVDRTTFQRLPADKITGKDYLANENVVALSPEDANIVSLTTNALPSLARMQSIAGQLKKATEGTPGATFGQALNLAFRDKTMSDSAVAAFKQDATKLAIELGRIYGGSSRVPVAMFQAVQAMESPTLSESLENTLTKIQSIDAEIQNQRNSRVGLPLVPMPEPVGNFVITNGVRVRKDLLKR